MGVRGYGREPGPAVVLHRRHRQRQPAAGLELRLYLPERRGRGVLLRERAPAEDVRERRRPSWP